MLHVTAVLLQQTMYGKGERIQYQNGIMGDFEILGHFFQAKFLLQLSLVLLHAFTSPSGDMWCSSCCVKPRLRFCNESGHLCNINKTNYCQPAVCWRPGYRGCLTTEGSNNLLERRERAHLEEEKLRRTLNLLRLGLEFTKNLCEFSAGKVQMSSCFSPQYYLEI